MESLGEESLVREKYFFLYLDYVTKLYCGVKSVKYVDKISQFGTEITVLDTKKGSPL